MNYIDPHAHMICRTTDDYRRMALAGCIAVTEPAFWPGYDRTSPQAFHDYFTHITQREPQRAADYNIAHYAWICMNPKEAEDTALAREVLALIPEFLDKPTVLGIGEIGLNKNTRNELQILEDQIALAAEHDQLILVHTPHLEDKLKGTRLILDAIKRNGVIHPGRVLIDHVEEHTVALALDRGHWAGMSLYADSKCTPQRAADIIETYGHERIVINSACDWGHGGDPMTVPQTRLELTRRGHLPPTIQKLTHTNPTTFLRQSPKFRPRT